MGGGLTPNSPPSGTPVLVNMVDYKKLTFNAMSLVVTVVQLGWLV